MNQRKVKIKDYELSLQEKHKKGKGMIAKTVTCTQ